MKNLYCSLFFSLITITLYGQEYSEFLVKTDSELSSMNLVRSQKIESTYSSFIHPSLSNVHVIYLTEKISLAEFKNLLKDDNYELAEPAPIVELFWTPNDYDNNSYHLDLIQAEEAWNISNDGSSVVIGIIDDAVDINHADLASNIWTNTLEIPNNGIDEDGNGFIDDTSGWDFGNNDNTPTPYDGLVNLTHGTHVAGIAAGVTNNSQGVSSLSANAKILPVKIAQSANGGLTNTIQSVDYAIAMGADVINMSWGGPMYSGVMQALFNAAAEEGVICVASAGNSNSNLPMYPASYDNVISVASSDQNDEKSWFSNYGPTVDIIAPGSDIYSAVYGESEDYMAMSGTSMSGPLTASLIALMKSANPLATVLEIEECLYSTAEPINGAFQNEVGAGRINAFAALQCLTELTSEFTSDYTQICSGNDVQFFNYTSGDNVSYFWEFEGGSPSTSTEQFPIINYNGEGQFDVTLTVNDGSESSFESISNYLLVSPPHAEISGLSQVYPGGYGSVIVNFQGNAPYSLEISDGENTYSYNSILDNNFSEIFQASETTNIEIISFSDSQCSGTFSGEGLIEVLDPLIPCEAETASFMKYLGTEVDDFSHGLVYLEDLGYLVLGRKNVGTANYRNYIALVDECGILMWEKLFNTGQYGIARSGHLINNQLKIIGYHEGPPSNYTYLMTLDLQGNLLDTQIFGGSQADYPRESDLDQDGNIVIGGVTNSPGTFGANDMYVAKCTPDGSMIWSTRIGGTAHDFNHGVMVDSNNDILATGKFESYVNGVVSGAAVKLDEDGNVLWSKSIGTGSGSVVFGGARELNGAYYITGITDQNTLGDQDGILIKLDYDGNTIWSKLIGGTGSDGVADIVLNGENLVLYGHSNSGQTDSDLFLAEITEDGEILSTYLFGSENDDVSTISGKTLINPDGQTLIPDYWHWSFGDGTEENSIASENSYLYSEAGTYEVEVIAGNLQFGCLDTLTTSVQIDPVSTANCEFSLPFDASLCINESVFFSNISITDNSNVSYQWFFSGPASIPNYSGFEPPAITYSSAGSFSVVLEMYLDCGTLTFESMISIFEPPSLELPEDIYGCQEAQLLTDEPNISSWNYLWSPAELFDEPTSFSQDLTFTENNVLHLTILDTWTGCSSSDSILISVDSTFVYFEDEYITLCNEENASIPYISSNWQDVTFNWNLDSQTENEVTLNSPNSLTLVAEISLGECYSSDSLEILVQEVPSVDNINICYGNNLMELLNPNWVYSGNSEELIFIENSGTYTFTENLDCGTISFDVNVFVEECDCQVYVPNAFTPNLDQVNPVFGPETVCQFDHYLFQIFNRWGELIFESTEADMKWPGTYKRNMVQDGIYTWRIKYSTLNNPVTEQLTGHVTVLR